MSSLLDAMRQAIERRNKKYSRLSVSDRPRFMNEKAQSQQAEEDRAGRIERERSRRKPPPLPPAPPYF
jgi:hypothetical protein